MASPQIDMLAIDKSQYFAQPRPKLLISSTTNKVHECFFFFNKVLNIWKSYMWTAEWRIKWRMIMAVIYATFAVAKRKPETKKFRQVRDSNPWPLRYQAWIFFRLSCSNCKSCVCNCDDHRSFKCFCCCCCCCCCLVLFRYETVTCWGFTWKNASRTVKLLTETLIQCPTKHMVKAN